jgi:hypothetical protein
LLISGILSAHMSSWDLATDPDPATLAPWDRQPGESSRNYEKFCLYRNMGPGRSVQALRNDGIPIGASIPTRDQWDSRAVLWDDYEERVRRNEIIKETRAMARKQATQASDMAEALMAPVVALQARLEKDPEDTMTELAGMDIGKLLEKVQASARVLQPIMNAERLARGLPTEITEGRKEHVHTIDYGDKERLEQILEALEESDLLSLVIGARASGEVVDAEVVEMGAGEPTPEAGSLPASATA